MDNTLMRGETRAVVPLLGFVLLFGVAVISFSMYQAEIVPDQNAQTEFQHFEDTQRQMIAVRSAAIDTASDDLPRSVTFDLGTRFQQRYFAVNPPPPTGELTTSDQYEVIINPDSDDISVPARFLEFDPNYRELQASELRYEHGIVYRDAGDDQIVILDDLPGPNQNQAQLVPLQGELSETGHQRTTIELYRPNGTTDLPEITEVELQTRLPDPANGQWSLTEALGVPAESVDYDGSTDPSTITIDGDNISAVTPVGIQERPESASSTAKPSGSIDDSNDNRINDVRASELIADTNNQEQEFAIDLGQDLEEGQKITINLGFNTEGITYSTGNQYEVVDGDGEINKNGDLLTYTAGANDNAGDTITITADKVQVDSIAGERRSIEASTNGESETAEFPILKDGDFDSETYEGGDVFVTGNVDVEGGQTITGDIVAGEDVTVKDDGEVQGSIESGGAVEVKDGGRVQQAIDASGEVTVADQTGGIVAGEDVTVKDGGEVQGSIDSGGAVEVKDGGEVQGSIESGGAVEVKNGGKVQQAIDASGEVTVADQTGGIVAGEDVTIKDGGKVQGSIESGGAVEVKDGGVVEGSIDADGEVTVKDGGEVQGSIEEG